MIVVDGVHYVWLSGRRMFLVSDCDKCKMVSNVLGYLPDECDCRSFYQCENTTGGWRAHHMPCAPCTEWNQDIVTCGHVDYDCHVNDVIKPEMINFVDGKLTVYSSSHSGILQLYCYVLCD